MTEFACFLEGRRYNPFLWIRRRGDVTKAYKWEIFVANFFCYCIIYLLTFWLSMSLFSSGETMIIDGSKTQSKRLNRENPLG
jgi:hypothetical protein